jgi:hypothetical protein
MVAFAHEGIETFRFTGYTVIDYSFSFVYNPN